MTLRVHFMFGDFYLNIPLISLDILITKQILIANCKIWP